MIKVSLLNKKKGDGNGSLSIPKYLSDLFGSHWFQLWIILILMGCVLAWLLAPASGSRIPQYEVGMIAASDIKADEDFLVEDRAATEQKIAESAKEAPLLYEYSSYLPNLIASDMIDAFQMAGAALRESSEGIDEAAWTSDAIEAVRTAFETKAGISLTDDELDQLVESGFSLEIAELIVHIITRVYENPYIVKEKDEQFSYGGPVTVYEPVSRDEMRTVDPEDISTLLEAKQSIEAIRDEFAPDSESLLSISASLAERVLRPSLTFSSSATEQNRRRIMDEVKPVFFRVLKNEMIVREGQKITAYDLAKLRVLSSEDDSRLLGRVFLLAGTFLMVSVLALVLFRISLARLRSMPGTTKHILFMALMAVVQVILVKGGIFVSEAATVSPLMIDNPYLYAIPFATGPMIVAILLGNRDLGLIFSVFTAFLATFLFQDKAIFFLYAFCGSVVAVHFIVHCRKRSDFFKTGLLVGAINITVALAIILFSGNLLVPQTPVILIMALLGGLIAGIIVSGTVPLFEHLFGYTTDIRLLELANLNQPIFQEMIITAPGTYHHSIIVASMVEAAADEIGANSLLAKVGAFYHDVGKMKMPHYYVENQKAWENRHDNLKPSMSSRVIISHVKDGHEIAGTLKLGDELRNIIKQHHGTRLAVFFYEKAKKEQDPSLSPILESDFRYPGPKPQSKEAALVLLADIVEASSRVLKDPTPSRINALIDTRFKETVDDNQLDESDLTFSDLNKIAECFARILNGIFHHRIEYYASQGSEPAHEQKNGSTYRKPSVKKPRKSG